MITEKLAVDADNFGLQGADIFDGVFKNSLNLQKSQLVGFCATLQAEVDKEAAIFFANKVISVFVQFTIKYRQMTCIARRCLHMTRSTSSVRALRTALFIGQVQAIKC